MSCRATFNLSPVIFEEGPVILEVAVMVSSQGFIYLFARSVPIPSYLACVSFLVPPLLKTRARPLFLPPSNAARS
jgi:hypothetical protein